MQVAGHPCEVYYKILALQEGFLRNRDQTHWFEIPSNYSLESQVEIETLLIQTDC